MGWFTLVAVTFATQITCARIALVPVFAALALAYGLSVKAGAPNESLRWWALGVFIAASASDGIDGWIARKFNQKSDLGAFLDPLADKTLLLTGILVLSLVDWGKEGWSLPLWFALLAALRDIIIVGGLFILKRRGKKVVISPSWVGKICTVTQMFALGWVMLKVVPYSPAIPAAIASFFTVWSGVRYFRQGWGALRGGEAQAV